MKKSKNPVCEEKTLAYSETVNNVPDENSNIVTENNDVENKETENENDR